MLFMPFMPVVLVAACGPGTDDSGTGSATTTTEPGTGDPPTTTTPPTTGEESSGSTTDAPPAAGECAQDSDCILINDCCTCDAAPADAPIKPCEGNCLQSSCDAEGLRDVRVACRLGVCEFAEVDCSEGPVACDETMPSCPEGTRVSVQDGCWGPCVHPRYCLQGEPCPSGGCGAGWTCVQREAGGSVCEVVPLECAGTLGCVCAAPYLDELCPGECSDDSKGAVTCLGGG